MFAKLKVNDLSAHLSPSGLDIVGTKLILVEHLDAALRKEHDAASSIVPNAGKKRQREPDPMPFDPEPADGVTSVVAKDLQVMGVHELQDLSMSREAAVVPSKGKEIIEAVQDGFEGEEVKEKLVKGTKKGRRCSINGHQII